MKSALNSIRDSFFEYIIALVLAYIAGIFTSSTVIVVLGNFTYHKSWYITTLGSGLFFLAIILIIADFAASQFWPRMMRGPFSWFGLFGIGIFAFTMRYVIGDVRPFSWFGFVAFNLFVGALAVRCATLLYLKMSRRNSE